MSVKLFQKKARLLKSLAINYNKYLFFSTKIDSNDNNLESLKYNTINTNDMNLMNKNYTSTNITKYKGYVGDIIMDNDPNIPLRTRIMITIYDHPGALEDILRIFRKNQINLTRIESRFCQNNQLVNFFIDIDISRNDKRIDRMFKDFEFFCEAVSILGPREVSWFPITKQEVDSLGLLVLEGGNELSSYNPGYNDTNYRQRRLEFTEIANNYIYGDAPKIIDYTESENALWTIIWNKIEPLLYKHACDEYLIGLDGLKKAVGYSSKKIPQICDVSQYINQETGFNLRPVAGLLSTRCFLNGLAFRTFFCTQYLRHDSVPYFTTEPDVVHELVGHAPLLSIPQFADFVQQIGLASIGASDEQIIELARCLWFTVEFGLCKDKQGNRKVMGAGILSSHDEIEYSMGYENAYKMQTPPKYIELDIMEASKVNFNIKKYQPIYYVTNSLNDAKKQLGLFINTFKRPFTVKWEQMNKKLMVDAPIKRLARDNDTNIKSNINDAKITKENINV